MAVLDDLYLAVQTRPRPENVAKLVFETLNGDLRPDEREVMGRAAQYAFRRSGMPDDYQRPATGVQRQITLVPTMLPTASCYVALDEFGIEKVRQWIDGIRKEHRIHNRVMSKRARRDLGIYKNARWYNKRRRLLAKIIQKLENLERNQLLYRAVRCANGGFAWMLPPSEVKADLNTACFLAYYSSRMGLRSTFTSGKQVRAFDRVAQVLLERCQRSGTTNWFAIAHILPDEEIVRRLTPDQQANLLSLCTRILRVVGDALETVANATSLNLATMIVRPGNDSSTWNALAGAWNRIRAQWISLLYAMGIDGLLDNYCPGKVLRLMAADVARWHEATGESVHPDTTVWRALPWPWRVLHGDDRCPRSQITELCRAHGASAATWTAAPKNRKAVDFTPTPELVHGVIVNDPELGKILRRAGVFSGKNVQGKVPDIEVDRTKDGFATSVDYAWDSSKRARGSAFRGVGE